MKCGYEKCIGSFGEMPDELVTCLWVLFLTGFIYIFIGIYLYEVIPQQFGVRKHPFFCLKRLFDNKKKNKIAADLESSSMDKSNLKENDPEMDDEIKFDVERIKEMGAEKQQYPLVVDKLTKIYPSTGKGVKPKKALNGLSLILNNNEIFGLLG